MAQTVLLHLKRHGWFYLALAAGAVAWVTTPSLLFHPPFVFNTVLIALAVNTVVALVQAG
jgi:hypothetical protein